MQDSTSCGSKYHCINMKYDENDLKAGLKSQKDEIILFHAIRDTESVYFEQSTDIRLRHGLQHCLVLVAKLADQARLALTTTRLVVEPFQQDLLEVINGQRLVVARVKVVYISISDVA